MPLKGWRNNMIDLKNEKRDIYDYFDLIDQAKTKKEREGYIDEALLSEPNNLQLLLMKNEKNRKKQAEYLAGLGNIVSIGNKQMQDGGYFQNDKGDFWLVYETRPYMTACCQYLSALMENGFVTKAIKEGERLLELCKSDNLGVRYDLMHLFALAENKEKAEELFKAYDEEQTSQMMLPLCFLYYKIGETETAEKLLLKIKKINKDLLKFIKKVLADDVYFKVTKMLGTGYRPNTIEELLVEYDRYYNIFESCPLFFDWAKAVLSEKNI